jgi:hypothetical protein
MAFGMGAHGNRSACKRLIQPGAIALKGIQIEHQGRRINGLC